ncbi:transposase [Streptomyces griseoluteus]|uniref:transposase n=1 Tax=Streptomyces griseoluteus TaxID=29306 RepID=UPI0036792A80
MRRCRACADGGSSCSETKLPSDKGYDYDHLRKWLRERGIVPRIARRGVESSARLGRHRWVVERTMSWLSGCRRLHRRYERKPEHFIGFTAIAVMLICLRRLGVSVGR